MGAVASLLYASQRDPSAACVIADSPFASLRTLCADIVNGSTKGRVPAAVLGVALAKVRSLNWLLRCG